ncbi:unnamed protein product [Symbiodinium sp. CCMP2592]|nr:unnamed protein product [Symbiodinium sp. CCMP2592]
MAEHCSLTLLTPVQTCGDGESFCPHLCGLVLVMADNKACEDACHRRLPTIKAAVMDYCQGKFCSAALLDGSSLLQHRSAPGCDAREPYCERLCHGGLFQDEDLGCHTSCVSHFDILKKAYDNWCDLCQNPEGKHSSKSAVPRRVH